MRVTLPILCLSVFVCLGVRSPDVRAEIDLHGFASLQGQLVDGPPSWLEGGNGRFDRGGDRRGGLEAALDAEVHLGVDWSSGGSWRGQIHGIARSQSPERHGRHVGLSEAWLEYQRAVSNRSEIFLRGGLFFFPSSMENSDGLWVSPYTLSNSSINSWIGEEFRPQGLDLRWRHFGENDWLYSAGATLFYGNDTMGTQLAWRGWTLHRRLSVFGEVLPLPRLPSLDSGGGFSPQQRFASTGFGNDLDGRPGAAVRLSVRRPQQFELRLAQIDNRGDRQLHGDEYAWHTRFTLAGAQWQMTPDTEWLAEWMDGDTSMNFPGNPWVDAEFKAFYLMLSHQRETSRFSLRYDRYSVDDQLDNPTLGVFDDSGDAWTLAWLQPAGKHFRFGMELLIDGSQRRAIDNPGVPVDTSGNRLSLEWRWVF